MFRGNYPTRIDDKGRLKVPADFKRVIESKYGSSKFYITSFNGSAAMVFPMDEWEAMEREVMAKPKTLPARNKFLEVTSYYGQEVEMDAQGRLLIPALLRDKAVLTAEVSVLGQGEKLVVKNMEAIRKQVEENPFTDEDAEALSAMGS